MAASCRPLTAKGAEAALALVTSVAVARGVEATSQALADGIRAALEAGAAVVWRPVVNATGSEALGAVAVSAKDPSVAAALAAVRVPRGVDAAGRAWRDGKPARQSRSPAAMAPVREALASAGLTAAVAVPVSEADPAVIVTVHAAAEDPDLDDVAGLIAVAGPVVLGQFALARETAGRERAERHAERLTRVNHELEAFTHAAAHDLRAPLSSIIGALALVAGQTDPDSPAAEFITLAQDEGERFKRLLDALLHYAALGRDEPRLVAVDLEHVMHEVTRDLAEAIQARGAVVETGSLPIVQADRDLIYRALLNLVTNAVKYGGDALHVQVSATRNEQVCTVTVADNGPGIPPGEHAHVFEPFKRLLPGDGLGLGLAFCRRIVTLHGGTIWVEPGTTTGTVISFTLPRRAWVA